MSINIPIDRIVPKKGSDIGINIYDKKRRLTFLRKSFFYAKMMLIVEKARIRAEACGKADHYDMSVIGHYEMCCYTGGITLEENVEVIKETADTMEHALEVLQETVNAVQKTSDHFFPIMAGMVKKTRDTRMTVTTELNKSLNAMKDVRQFFLDSDYKIEIERLKEFVDISERMRSLIQDGTMDAITDVAIKLAIKEEQA
jgi:hypothetical protein